MTIQGTRKIRVYATGYVDVWVDSLGVLCVEPAPKTAVQPPLPAHLGAIAQGSIAAEAERQRQLREQAPFRYGTPDDKGYWTMAQTALSVDAKGERFAARLDAERAI